MATAPEIKVPVIPDASGIVRTARIIARHLTALADELEAPDAIIPFSGELTPEQLAEFKASLDGAVADLRRGM
jgi:hypothetical protein